MNGCRSLINETGNLRFVLVALTCDGAYADDVPSAAALAQEQAQAREFGIFFGGMATQYDLCAKKGFLPKSDRPAEETAKSILEKMRQFTPGPDQSAFVQEGWDYMKVFAAQHASDYTQEKCAGVAKCRFQQLVSKISVVDVQFTDFGSAGRDSTDRRLAGSEKRTALG